jgi:hypothetical protein
MTPLRPLFLAVVLALGAPLAAAQAPVAPTGGSVEQIRNSLLSLIRALVDQKVLTVAKAEQMLREAGIDPAQLAGPVAGSPPAAPPPRSVVRVPYVPEVVKRELRDEIRQEVLAQARAERWGDPGALPSWLSRMSLSGSVRVRGQADLFAEDNSIPALIDAFQQLPEGSTPNTSDDRERLRVRARLGLTARVADDVRAGLRLTTSSGGDTNSPVSANVDQGRFNQRYGVAWDLAYIEWSRPTFMASAGRIANPYLSTDLVWATDLTMDGLAISYRPRFSLAWSASLTAGLHPLREVAGGAAQLASDKWLYAAQLGADWRGIGSSTLRVGLAYYDYRNIEGRLNPAQPADNGLYNASAPVFRQRGNTMFNILAQSSSTGAQLFGVASKFQLVNFTFNYALGRFDPFRLGVSADYVRNIGYDRDEIAARIGSAAASLPFDRTGQTGIERRRTTGYRYEFQFGHALLEQFGQWQVFAGYRYLERDAVPDAFTSGDYRLGGTDVKGGFVGFNYALARDTSLTLRYVAADSIDLAPRLQVDSVFLDLNTRF